MTIEQLEKECEITTDRSSGPGGQHVNKTETKVTLKFDVLDSDGLTVDEKKRILQNGGSKIVQGRYIMVSAQESRSQSANKLTALKRCMTLLSELLYVAPPRKATKPTKASILARVKAKRITALQKEYRGNLKNKVSKSDEE